jgi:hypothetical protein
MGAALGRGKQASYQASYRAHEQKRRYEATSVYEGRESKKCIKHSSVNNQPDDKQQSAPFRFGNAKVVDECCKWREEAERSLEWRDVELGAMGSTGKKPKKPAEERPHKNADTSEDAEESASIAHERRYFRLCFWSSGDTRH